MDETRGRTEYKSVSIFASNSLQTNNMFLHLPSAFQSTGDRKGSENKTQIVSQDKRLLESSYEARNERTGIRTLDKALD